MIFGGRLAKKFVFILGGARSGKSRLAQNIAAKLGKKVIFVATGEPLDEEMASRIEKHKRMRPRDWRTLEIDSNIGQRLKEQIGNVEVVLLDCLTLLISNVILNEVKNLEKINFAEAEKRVMAEMKDLIECIDRYEGNFIIVSNEVGLGLVPESKLGRIYRDLLGKANQLLAQHANEVYFMASGIPVKLKSQSL